MSDTVRVFSKGTSSLRLRRMRRRKAIFYAIVGLLFVTVLLFFWTTRNSFSLEDFATDEAQVCAYATHLAELRAILNEHAQTALAAGVPIFTDMNHLDRKTFVSPEWVLNNVLAEQIYVSADAPWDKNWLIITEVSRFGRVMLWLLPYFARTNEDYAGGLHIRFLTDNRWYYTLRGRLLFLSPDRDRLIRTLTGRGVNISGDTGKNDGNRPRRMVTDEFPVAVVARALKVTPDISFDLSARIQYTEDAIRARLTFTVNDTTAEKWHEVLESIQPTTLHYPPDGVFRLSFHAGVPLRRLYQMLVATVPDETQGNTAATEANALSLASFWSNFGPTGTAFSTLLEQLWNTARGEVFFLWRGMDSGAPVPVPQCAAGWDADPDLVQEIFSTSVAAGAAADSAAESTKNNPTLVSLPILGEDALQPTLGHRHGLGVVLASHRGLAESLCAEHEAPGAIPQTGNLYVQIRPQQVCEALEDTLRQLAALGLIRGHTEKTFLETWDKIKRLAQHYPEYAMLGWVEYPSIVTDVRLVFRKNAGE